MEQSIVKELMEYPIKSAYSYAELGWAIIPLSSPRANEDTAGKRPLLKGWQNRGVPTTEEIDNWLKEYPTANVGLVMGSNSGIVGVDVDGSTGETILIDWSNGELPETWEFITPGGGRRLLYKVPEGLVLRKTSKSDRSKVHEELALLGEGNQTVIPPSIHKNQGKYEWINGKEPWSMECAMAPDWLIKKMAKPQKENKPQIEGFTGTSNSLTDIITRLSEKCQLFKKDWQDQSTIGLDEETWFKWISLLIASGHPERAMEFSMASDKHSSRSDYRIKNLIERQEHDNIPPVRCTTFGCPEEQVLQCFGQVNRNEDGEATNSPGRFITRNPRMLYFEKNKFRAKWLGDDIMKDYHFIFVAGELYVYRDGLYVPGGKDIVRKECTKRLRKEYSSNYIKETFSYISDTSICELKEVNPKEEIINLKNGLYNINTGELLEHSPKYKSTVQLNVSYNDKAIHPTFERFLKDTLNPDNIKLVQEIFGYSLVPYTQAQKAFIFYGAGQTGKSTLLDVLISLLGKQNVSSIPLQNLGDRFRGADLFGKLANIVADLPSRLIDDAGIFKSIVGEDTITSEKKYQDAFTYKPTARLIFSCNSLPPTNDQTSGFFRRLIIIPFNNVVPEAMRDNDLKAKLNEEKEGILLWALEGLKRLINKRFVFSENESTQQLLNDYRRTTSIVHGFIIDCCIIDPKLVVGKTKLYDEYIHYCQDNFSESLSNKDFNKELKAIYPFLREKQHGESRERVWSGLGLAN